MSDLSDEMRQLASDAAAQARPMAIADVIRRGDRRRTRTIAQRSLGGLSAVGLGAAVLFTGVTHHPASNPAASGTVAGDQVLNVSTSSANGILAMRVKYRDLAHGKIKIESVTYSGSTKKALKFPGLMFTFGPGLTPGNESVFVGFAVGLKPSQLHHFSGSLPRSIVKTLGRGSLAESGSLGISLESIMDAWVPAHQKPVKDTKLKPAKLKPAKPLLTATVILAR